jgi:dihydroflavonol-4-reductase
MDGRGLVLVTGGSGYIASFCIAHLIREGWQVRTTVRSLARADQVRATLASVIETVDRLSFVAADLNADAGWAEAAVGASYVLHVASPVVLPRPRPDHELVRPARDGTLRVLAAAKAAGVRRVVMTSSMAAICHGRGIRSTPFTEDDWSDETNRADTSAYERAKTIAERAAWQWIETDGQGIELVAINPGLVLGPVLSRDYSLSIEVVKRLLDGSAPALPRFGWPLVDVRDVAALHVCAMTHPQAAGQRFIAAGPFYWLEDIARTLRAGRPELARRVTTRGVPDWLVRAVALVDPMLRERAFELGRKRHVSAAKAKNLLGWSPRSNDEAILATADSLAAHRIV